MTSTIELPIPRDYAKRGEEIRALAEELVKGSIVTQAMERLLIQVLTEVHESKIRPLLADIERLATLTDNSRQPGEGGLTAYEAQVLIGTSISGCNMSPDRTFDLPAAWARLHSLGLIDRMDGLAIATPAGVDLIAAMLASSPSHQAAEVRVKVRTLDEWSEDDGDVVWWTLRDGEWLGEPAYIGTPLDLGFGVPVSVGDNEFVATVGGWPGYHTHWTPHPDFPALSAVEQP